MRIKKRHIILAFIGFLIWILLRQFVSDFRESFHQNVFQTYDEIFLMHSINDDSVEIEVSKCNMANCFNMSRCLSTNEFKIYVYPSDNVTIHSGVYSDILRVFLDSNYITNDADSACLFVLTIDTIDRDRRSENYVKQMNELIHNLPINIWNEGRNHLIFNLYHGTFPDYADHNLGFNTGYAMIARASANSQIFRRHFDLSFPLFHRQHSIRTSIEAVWPLKLKDKHLVSFKGKRYVYGIGSETRDSLYHLHNGNTVVMVTTCKHNNDWKKYEDARCEDDNLEYERWDYEEMMSNSTFCLTPRGRRLGSFRFLEALRLGCIPVILSDDWELPFSEIIDWSEAVVVAHEKTVLLVSDFLSSIPLQKIIYMKQKGRSLYQQYFSSVEKIVITSIQIIEERIRKQLGKEPRNWNGINSMLPKINNTLLIETFTVVIHASGKNMARLRRLIKIIDQIEENKKIIIKMDGSIGVNFQTKKSLEFVNDDNMYFMNADSITDNFVLFIEERVSISKRDLLSIIKVSQLEQNRLVGYYAAYHKGIDGVWSVNLFGGENFSIALPYFTMIHKAYLAKFLSWAPMPAVKLARHDSHCFFLLLNFMVTELSSRPPIIIERKAHDEWMSTANYSSCINKLVSQYWPNGPSLLTSSIVARIDPL